ncbi:hypothetical protein BDR06DRAFT_959392 [Suillus hirtellus]|nr:hypothetical protein BDR06DRAFT_959392 [Suillus hirtellus]
MKLASALVLSFIATVHAATSLSSPVLPSGIPVTSGLPLSSISLDTTAFTSFISSILSSGTIPASLPTTIPTSLPTTDPISLPTSLSTILPTDVTLTSPGGSTSTATSAPATTTSSGAGRTDAGLGLGLVAGAAAGLLVLF